VSVDTPGDRTPRPAPHARPITQEADMTVVESRFETEALARTRALIPELRARAERAVLDRQVPDENIAAMREAGSFKTIQSTRNGGYGLGMRAHLDTLAALGEGCGSTGWVAGVVQAHSWLLTHFAVEAQDEIYGVNPDAVVSAVIGPRGRATRTADGYLLSGVWPFASGNRNSDWLLLGGVVVDESGAVVDEGDFALPTTDAEQRDDWFTVGLAGTGSSTVAVDNYLVPAHRFLSLAGLVTTGKGPGSDASEGWNQRCAPVPVLALALTGSAIGVARRALQEFPAMVKGKTIAYTAGSQYDHPLTHVQMGDAAMRIHEGELILYHCADQIDEAGRAGREIPFATRARMRLDCAMGVHRLLEGVEILFHAGGASGIRSSSPLTRAVADLRAANQHGLLNLEMNQELYGRVLLGLEPNTPLI
jgi:3-hydroxy-9,10-secoandrosta-1,3,5(10)-triene-9,17-dione monooxygenase